MQGYKINVRTSSSALILDSDLSQCVFGKEEMCTESRLNRFFVLNYAKTHTHNESTSPKFIMELRGLTDKHVLRMKCRCPKLTTIEFPRALSPQIAQRLAAAMEISPAAVIESKLNDTAFQWIISQQEDRTRFQEQRDVPSAKREIFGVRLAFTLKSSKNK